MQANAVPTLPVAAAYAPYLRVHVSGGELTKSGDSDNDIGTLNARTTAAGEIGSFTPRTAPGLHKMVAAGAFDQFARVYAAADGKVDDVSNANEIGIAWQAASGDGSIVNVLRNIIGSDLGNLGSVTGPLVLDEDFLGDWPAAGTALGGEGKYAWSKTETNGLGVIPADDPDGVLVFSADAVAEAATNALYLANAPFDIDRGPVFECLLAVFDIGDHAALDINFGLADDTHATDADLIDVSIFVHLDGNDLSLKCECDDGTNETAATDTTVDLVDDTWYAFKIDVTDKSDVKFFYRAVTSETWIRLLPGTTFDVSDYTGTLTPIVHVEKTSNDTTYDIRADRVRVQCGRNSVA